LAVSYAAGAVGFDLRPEPVPDMSRKRLRQKVSDSPVFITNATADTVTPRFWAIDMTRAFKTHSFLELVTTFHCITAAQVACIHHPVEKYLIKRELPDSKVCS